MVDVAVKQKVKTRSCSFTSFYHKGVEAKITDPFIQNDPSSAIPSVSFDLKLIFHLFFFPPSPTTQILGRRKPNEVASDVLYAELMGDVPS